MEGEKLPSSRATKERIRVKRKVVTKSCKEESFQVRESENTLGRNSISWKDLEERKECRSQMREQEKGQEPRCWRMLATLVVQSVVVDKAGRQAGDSSMSG